MLPSPQMRKTAAYKVPLCTAGGEPQGSRRFSYHGQVTSECTTESAANRPVEPAVATDVRVRNQNQEIRKVLRKIGLCGFGRDVCERLATMNGLPSSMAQIVEKGGRYMPHEICLRQFWTWFRNAFCNSPHHGAT